MNVLLFVLEIFVVLFGIALVPSPSELRTYRLSGILDEPHSKRSHPTGANRNACSQ
jgi:hypothetical protein